MDKQSLLNKISFILQDLKTQHLKLTGNVDRIPEIDLDLFLANASFLVNHLEVLKKINGTSPEVKERDDILRNLFNTKELERLLENNSPNFQEEFGSYTNSSTEPGTLQQPNEKEGELLPQNSSTFNVEDNQVSNLENSENPPENAPTKSRNETFIDTQNNFVLPFSNKQGVFAPELERQAAYLADKSEEIDLSSQDSKQNQNYLHSHGEIQEKSFPGSLNDSFNQELKALRELNRNIETQSKAPFPSPPEAKSSHSNSFPPPINSQYSENINEPNPKSYHDLIASQKRELSLLGKLGSLPVKDIRKAIGLNEHLLFIKTLFQGDPAIYDRTLSMIDTFNSSEQAYKFLQEEIAIPFNWESKKAVAELFKNIVNRKFAGNR